MISLIAAMTEERVIGINNTIPWNLPDDLSWFKQKTLDKPVVMGRLTWESIGGRPLPGRKNIVISSYPRNSDHAEWVESIEEAIAVCNNAKEIMIIGGGMIYEQFLPKANRLYLTHIDKKIKGDVYFPKYKLNEWKLIFRKKYSINNKNPYNYYFEILERKTDKGGFTIVNNYF